jgi:uncharacterized membrane protein
MTPIPEPSMLGLLALALVAGAWRLRRWRQAGEIS